MLRSARDGGAAIAVASRYAYSGEVRGLGSVRIVTSQACTFAARRLFPRRMRDVTDPLSELIIVRREAIGPDSSRVTHFTATEIPLFMVVPHGAQPHSPGRGWC